MSEAELYKELGTLTKDKSRWKESLPYVSSKIRQGYPYLLQVVIIKALRKYINSKPAREEKN